MANIGCIEGSIKSKEGIKIQRQYRVGHHFVDGYDKENNVVYEVYEKHHFGEERRRKDDIRKLNIIKKLNCKFIIIKDIQ